MIERRILDPKIATIHLNKLFENFNKNKKINDEISTDILLNNKGAMFGILVCNDQNNNEIILKAFSGTIDSKYLIDGYVPPLFDVDKFNEVVKKYDNKIKELTSQIELDKNNRELINARKDLSNKSLLEIQSLYNFYDINGEIKNLSITVSDKYIPTGTGDCCAPKLLNYAFKNNLHPISIVEGFYGKNSENKEHLHIYPPCKERCGIILPLMLKLDILYVDEYICVINKQVNITTIPGKKAELKDCITSRIKKLFPFAIEQNSTHRLDMDTSGLLVLAFDKESHKNLSIQFQNREVEKHYVALLRGAVKQKNGIIDLPIRLDVDNRPYQIVDFEKGKKAVTYYERIKVEKNKKTGEITTRILFIPKTGRTHQLRLHSKENLFAIVGDRLYGVRYQNEKRMALHASSIKFRHPYTNEEMQFYSKEDF